MTNKIKNIAKMITLSPETWNRIDQLQQEHGLLKQQDAIRHCISFTWKKEHPAYIEAIQERSDRANEPLEVKAKKKVETEEAKEQARLAREVKKLHDKIENGRRIAGELRGEIHKDRSGNEKCTFYVYQFTNPQNASVGEKAIYLEDLTDHDIETQYMNTITNEPCPADQVIATLVELGLTDKEGKPI